MPGTIVILNSITPPPGRPNARTRYKVRIDGPAGNVVKGGSEFQYDVPPGTYRVRMSSGGLRTNALTVEVSEGRRHHVRISTTWYSPVTLIPFLGILPGLVGLTWPGLVFRIRDSQT